MNPQYLRARLAVGLVGLAVLAYATPALAQENGVYRFSPVNPYGTELNASYWNPIIDYVSTNSGVKLPVTTAFVSATGADYTGYRNFYQTASASLR